MLDMIGWLAEQVDFDRFEYNREHYDFAAPPNNQVPRKIERNVWKIEWQ